MPILGQFHEPQKFGNFSSRVVQSFETQDTAVVTSAAFQSKHIELSFWLVDEDGIYQMIGDDKWDELKKLFSAYTPFGFDFLPPVLIVRVRVLPQKPWPLTVAGMLL
jgi:hypothetical protein